MKTRPSDRYSFRKNFDLLAVVCEMQSYFLTDEDPAESFNRLLHSIIKLTQSERGFIAEVRNYSNRNSLMKIVGQKGMLWNEDFQSFYESNGSRPRRLKKLNEMTRSVLKTGQPAIFNSPILNHRLDVKNESPSILRAFLGLPIFREKRMIGMIGLLNRPRGFDSILVSTLKPLLLIGGNMMEAFRINEGRKEAEQERRASEERFRMMADTAPVMIWMSGRDKLCTYFNKTWLEFTGRTLEQEMGNGWTEGVHPEDYRRCLNAYVSAFDHRQSFQMEYRLRHRSGEYRWILDHGTPYYLSHGKFNGYIGSCVDITDRKKMEEEIQSERDKAQKYLDVAAAIFVVIDSNQKAVLINKKGCEILGYEESEIVGKNWFDHFIPEALRDRVKNAFSDLICGNIAPVEYFENPILQKNGQVRLIAWHNTVLQDDKGRIYSTLSFGEDITESKRSQDALLESEERYRSLFDHMINGIALHKVIVDERNNPVDLEYVDVNNAFEVHAGVKRPEAIGKRVSCIFPGIDQFQPNLIELYGQVGLTGESRRIEVYFEPLKKWFSISAYSPRKGYCATISEDITHRKNVQEDLTRSEKALRKSQENLRNLAGKLLNAQEEERRRLSRELHDDITQRLAVLAIEFGKLEKQLKEFPETASKKLGELKDQVVKLSSDVHGFSRRLHPSILEDLGVVFAIESECKAFSERDGIPVGFYHKNIPKHLSKNVSLCLYRIVQEGLRNSGKHSRAKKIDVTLLGQSGGVTLKIQDFGIGFDSCQLQEKRGLGLASMRERARLIQGEFSIQSKPGKGTTVKVCVPLEERIQ